MVLPVSDKQFAFWKLGFRTNAYISASEKDGMQAGYEHDCDCRSCDDYTQCIENIWNFASEMGIMIEKTAVLLPFLSVRRVKIREEPE